jgi:hypothetical protein
MKLFIAFLFGLSVCVAASSKTQQTSTPPLPSVTIAPTIRIPDTATPTASIKATIPLIPTQAPFPVDLYQVNPRFVTDPELAIDYSLNCLILRDYYIGNYENALYTPIQFPDGSKGSCVALGFDPSRHGYKFVYRIGRDSFELIQLWEDEYSWGTTWGKAPHLAHGKASLDFPELIYDVEGKPIPLIEISGVHYPGGGMIDGGHIQILQIVNDGIKVIFSGSKLVGAYAHMGEENEYHYQYLDLNNDKDKEIIKSGEECNVVENDDGNWRRINCNPIHEIYKYNGDVYVKQP